MRTKQKFYFKTAPVEKVQLDSETVDSWLDAADRRDTAVAFEQMDRLLTELRHVAPLRVFRLRRDIAWLVKQADKRNLRW